jgi:hypothetical protein
MRIYADYRRETRLEGPPATASGGQFQSAPTPKTVDVPVPSAQNYVERILKLIPGEVIVIYPVITTLLNAVPNRYFGTSLAGLIAVGLTCLLRARALPKSERPQPSAIFTSAVACLLWVYHEKGYIFLQIPEGWENMSTVVLIVFIIIAAPLIPGEKRLI